MAAPLTAAPLSTADGTPAASGTPANLPRLRAAAQDFEAMAVGEMLKPMFDTVDPSANPFGGGAAEAAWRPMLVQQIAKEIAKSGGLGLAGPVLQEMIRLQERKG